MTSVRFIDAILNGPKPDSSASTQTADGEALDAYSRTVTGVAETLIPSVASLKVTRRLRNHREVTGAGSGVIITPDGFLLTSAHVISESDGGTATFSDGRELEFEIIGVDGLSDLGVIRARASDLPTASLGDASELRVGQLVVAVGNPLGFSGSITAGVVSALGRSFPTRAGANTRFVEDVIQTDAALNPGNSGGALADSRSRVVGINTAVAGIGLGLAVPINDTTRRIVAALMTEGRFRRAVLGITCAPRPLPPRIAAAVGREAGIEIVEVFPDSPAGQAGLRPEDLILDIDGVPMRTSGDLQRFMVGRAIGAAVNVAVFRVGEVLTVPVKLSELT